MQQCTTGRWDLVFWCEFSLFGGAGGDVGVGFGLGFLCDAGSLVARVGVGRAERGWEPCLVADG